MYLSSIIFAVNNYFGIFSRYCCSSNINDLKEFCIYFYDNLCKVLPMIIDYLIVSRILVFLSKHYRTIRGFIPYNSYLKIANISLLILL